MTAPATLIASNISKRFASTQALENVSFSVLPGEVHALVGENGAGKSTLVKIICGAHKCDQGEIIINGNKVAIECPKDALEMGIATMYQEFNLLPDLSVTANLFIGREKTGALNIMKFREMQKEAKKLCHEIGLNVDERTLVASLSTAEKQLLEIVKGIVFKARIIFMDEPSAILTESEVHNLFRIIRKLTAEGVSIVYISHRLEEIFEIADIVTVLKDGKHVITAPIENFKSKEDVVRYMIGREISEDFYGKRIDENVDHTSEILSVRGLNSSKIRNASFKLYKGEILGLAGLVGSGRTEIVRLLFGADKKDSGQLKIDNKEVEITSPQQAIKNGIGLIPEDRALQGIILDQTIRSNVSLAIFHKLIKFGIVDFKLQKEIVIGFVKKLGIKLSSIESMAKNLSGGNQQKAIIAKWLATQSQILIMDEPTRGIDVGAKAEIYRILRELAAQGVSLIVVSSELPEILSLCDRILVVRDGQIVSELSHEEATEELIMLYATGQKQFCYESAGV